METLYIIALIISGIFNIIAITYISLSLKDKKYYDSTKLEYETKLSSLIEREEKVKMSEQIINNTITEKEKILKKNYQEKVSNIEKTINQKEEILKNKQSDLEKEYKEKIKLVNSIVIGKTRKGFYKGTFSQEHGDDRKTKVTVDIYVEEIDRYKNGKSKIKLLDIDYTSISGFSNLFNKTSNEKYIRETFKQLVNTNDIEWLESVDEISKERKKKFERILGIQDEDDGTIS